MTPYSESPATPGVERAGACWVLMFPLEQHDGTDVGSLSFLYLVNMGHWLFLWLFSLSYVQVYSSIDSHFLGNRPLTFVFLSSLFPLWESLKMLSHNIFSKLPIFHFKFPMQVWAPLQKEGTCLPLLQLCSLPQNIFLKFPKVNLYFVSCQVFFF